MNLQELVFPSDLHYLVEHDVWARLEADGTATVGITALGIKLSGEIYMCRAKPVGTGVEQGRSIAVVELAKAIVSVKCAVSGTVLDVNPRLEEAPHLVHTDPYGEGWIARLALADFERDRAQLVQGEAVQAAMAQHAAFFEGSP
ncbi:MAG TPA: glycine cleavage system protein H [Rhizobacter sp.]